MTGQHTPGPWKLGGPVKVTVLGADGLLLQSTYRSTAERQANARLIASAPALLEALQNFSAAVRPIRDGERNGAAFGILSAADDIAQNIIRQATGEE